METIILIVAIVLIAFSLLIFLLSRYKKCPSDKIMVIYGNVGKNKDGSALVKVHSRRRGVHQTGF